MILKKRNGLFMLFAATAPRHCVYACVWVGVGVCVCVSVCVCVVGIPLYLKI